MYKKVPVPETHVVLFQGKPIRSTMHNNETWFVVTDVVAALIDSANPKGYLAFMRRSIPQFAQAWTLFTLPLPFPTSNGPHKFNCANMDGLLRIIHCIPSPKADFFRSCFVPGQGQPQTQAPGGSIAVQVAAQSTTGPQPRPPAAP